MEFQKITYIDFVTKLIKLGFLLFCCKEEEIRQTTLQAMYISPVIYVQNTK